MATWAQVAVSLFSMIVVAVTFAEYFGYKKMTVRVDNVNVRYGAGTSYPIVTQYPKGKTVFVFKTVKDERGREWVKVNYSKKRYIAKWLLK